MGGLTKQHFKKIAKIVNKHIVIKENEINDNQIILSPMNLCDNLADYFATQNPLFNKERFLKACLE